LTAFEQELEDCHSQNDLQLAIGICATWLKVSISQEVEWKSLLEKSSGWYSFEVGIAVNGIDNFANHPPNTYNEK
jgi:hypothetical protein